MALIFWSHRMTTAAADSKLSTKTRALTAEASQESVLNTASPVFTAKETGARTGLAKGRRPGKFLDQTAESAETVSDTDMFPSGQASTEGTAGPYREQLLAQADTTAEPAAAEPAATPADVASTTSPDKEVGGLIPAVAAFSPMTAALGGLGLAAVAGGGGGSGSGSAASVNHAPVISSVNSASVIENSPASTVIYKVLATDADTNTTLKYSLGGADKDFFTINASTGEVTLKTAANYESRSSYSIDVIASDGALTDKKAVTVNVTNVDEPATITDASTSTGYVYEDGNLHTEGQLYVTDPDAGQAAFQIPASLKGEYGSFTFDAQGKWTYQLDNQLIQSLREGYYLEDKLMVRSLDGSAWKDLVVTILGADDQARFSFVQSELVSDTVSVKVNEAVDPNAATTLAMLSIGTMDYDDRVVVESVKLVSSDSLDGSGLTKAMIEEKFLSALTLDPIYDNGGVHNLHWSFYTGATLPEGFHMVLEYTLASVNAHNTLNAKTVDTQTITIDVTGVNSPVTMSVKGTDSDTLSLTETGAIDGYIVSKAQTLTVNEWDYGDIIDVKPTAKINLEKSNFITAENIANDSGLEERLAAWLIIDEFGDLSTSSNLHWHFENNAYGELDVLPEGGTLVIDYTLACHENGSTVPVATHMVEVTLHGKNDKPVYYVFDARFDGDEVDSAAAELDLAATTPAKAQGTLSPYDPDANEEITHQVMGLTLDAQNSKNITAAEFASLKTNLNLQDLLTLDGDATFGDFHSLTWYFNKDGANLSSSLLNPGDVLAMDYTLRVTDLHGAFTEQSIHIVLMSS
ncbi:MAG: hypothetical protein E6Q48_08035 [Limnohabitans sp.]|nr:MAG: hypothetical protein E6Q48_08035 [Limnohabitans sp.]